MDFDKFAEKHRSRIVLLAAISVLPAIGFHLWMWLIFYDSAPGWAVFVAFVTEMSVLLGIGSLLDSRKE